MASTPRRWRFPSMMGLAVGVTLALGNGLNYLFHIAVSRLLGPSSYGALGALIAVLFVVGIPGVAVQAVVARHTVLADIEGRDLAAPWASILRWCIGIGIGVSVMVAVLNPVLSTFFHLGTPWPGLWLAAAVAPILPLSALQGMAQGRERYSHLALIVISTAAGRLALGVAAAGVGLGVSGVLAGATAGSVIGCAVAVGLVRPSLSRVQLRSRLWPEFVAASAPMLLLYLLASFDLALARHYLPPDAVGLFAVGTVMVSALFWGPLFVVWLAFPHLVRERRGPHLIAAARTIGGICVAALVLVAAVPGQLLRTVFGGSYVGLGPALWLFGGIGTSYALVQLAVSSGIAAGRVRITPVLGAALVAKDLGIVFFFHRSVHEMALLGLVTSLVVLVIAIWFEAMDPISAADHNPTGLPGHAN